MNTAKIAELHSLTCFMNSLLREKFNYVIKDNNVLYKIDTKRTLRFPLKKESFLGRHHYDGKIFLLENTHEQELCFIDAATLISKSLIQDPENIEPLTATFINRLKNSIENIEISLNARHQDIINLYKNENISFEQAEQGLFIGHNFHPYPKMREGFADSDYEKYSPEMGAAFNLIWFAVDKNSLTAYHADCFTQHSWTQDLALQEGFEVPANKLAFPFHPWQYKTLKAQGLLDSFSTDAKIQELGVGKLQWYPTSSLRSIYSPDANFMLKFSLSLKLTNSIRHLTDVEVVRGMQVFDVMESPSGREFQKKHPNFQVISEPSFLGLKNSAQKTLNETLVVARENPFPKTSTNNIVVSTLAQDHPFFEENLIVKNIQAFALQQKISLAEASLQWFNAYLDCCVMPLIDGQANFGFLLGAHQQNLIIGLLRNLPVKGYFRDCQGTGYSELGFELYSKYVSTLVRSNGNILDEKGNILFGYYLMINSTFNVIAAISDTHAVTEKLLIETLKQRLILYKETNPKDSSFLRYILESPEIYHKGNFYCSIENINENTTQNPLAIYNLIPNPLFIGE